MSNLIINTGKTSVTINTCHNVTVTESSIIVDLATASAMPKKTVTAAKKAGRPAGSKSKKTTVKKTVKK
tara:strand:+ start:565 stop:771 length:207 start_codon:yes stop_codon:yes gene_type:complete